MAVFDLLRRKRSNGDRLPATHAGSKAPSYADSGRFRHELVSFIENLLENRLMISAPQEVAFEAEANALLQVVRDMPPGADESEIFHHWNKIKSLSASRFRNEEIFVEGRFFEYQQLLFDFSKMIRQMEVVREATLKEANRVIKRADETNNNDIAQLKSLLEREKRELRSVSSAVSDRVQAIRNILLEDRRVPELDEDTRLLTRRAFESATSRYISISSCTAETLHLISFQMHTTDDLPILVQAVNQTFKRHADCKGRTNDDTISILALNVTHRHLLELAQRVSEFVSSVDLQPPVVFLAKGRFDDTPGMLRERLSALT